MIFEVKILKEKAAIVILNYNDKENTIKYVNQIKEYDILSKIIVVDNLSTTENEFKNLQVLKSSKVDIIQSEKNGGYSYGNNFGLRYIDDIYENEFEYVIISNPDVSVKEINILKTIEFLNENKKVAIASPRMYFSKGPARRSAWKKRKYSIDLANCTRLTQLFLYLLFKSGEYSKKDFEKEYLKVEAIAGSFFIAKHKIFKEVGYFDEKTFLFFEEDIIGDKLKEKGYEIYSLNHLKFMHYESQTIGKLYNSFKKQDMLFDSRIYYHKTYNKINNFELGILKIFRIVRKIELVFENPITKILSNIINKINIYDF